MRFSLGVVTVRRHTEFSTRSDPDLTGVTGRKRRDEVVGAFVVHRRHWGGSN